MSTIAKKRTRLQELPKDLAMRFAGRLGVVLNAMLGTRAGDSVGILTYHRISDHVPGLPAPLYNVTPDRFRQQISGLLERGYQFWSLREALRHHQAGTAIPPRTAIVTFDDGFGSVYAEAYPVLQELGVPATLFVNTAYLDEDAPFPFDAWGVAHRDRAPRESYRPLTTEECREMQASGVIDLGAHTHTHSDHRGNPQAFREDVQRSVDLVRSWFGVDQVMFAFPWGGRHTGFASDDLVAAAKQTDVTCALTTEPVLVDPASDPFLWGRFNAFPWDSSASLAAKLSGWYSWAPQFNKRSVKRTRTFLQKCCSWISPGRCCLKKTTP